MVMNTRDAIYGLVREDEENIIFKGETTDTAKVTVDNDRNKISVDVLVSNFLGKEDGQAYPGVSGRDLEHSVRQEISRAGSEEHRIEQKLEQTKKKVSSDIDNLSRILNARVDALSIDTGNSLDKLADKLDASVDELDSKVDGNKSELNANIEALSSKVDKNNTTLTKDVSDLNAALRETEQRLTDTINVTKEDLSSYMSDADGQLRKEMQQQESELKQLVESTEANLTSEISKVASDMVSATDAFKSDLSTQKSDLEELVKSTKDELEDAISSSYGNLKSEIEKTNDVIDEIQNKHAEDINNLSTHMSELDKLLTPDALSTSHIHSIQEMSGYEELKNTIITEIPDEYVTSLELEDRIGNIDFDKYVEEEDLVSSLATKITYIGGCTAATIMNT